MNDELIKKILDDDYDPTREDTWLSMVREFHSRKARFIAVYTWVWSIVFCALALYSAIQFFKAGGQMQIMYAALFLLGAGGVGVVKIIGCVMFVRHSIRRDIKRLELRVAELSEALKARQ